MTDRQPRILAGRFKGRPLATPRGLATRPLAARVRKSLFDILGPRVRGARVLDLYAGSGAVALEALSRGARSAVAVERAPAALQCLATNARRLAVGEALRVVAKRAERFADGAAADPEAWGGPFDLVYVGAPYPLWRRPRRGGLDDVLAALPDLLAPEGLAVVEHPGAEVPAPPGTRMAAERRYGDTRLTFLERAPLA